MLYLFAIAIPMAVRESQVPNAYFNDRVTRGTFSSAAAITLLSVLFYLIHIILTLPYLIKCGKAKRQRSDLSPNSRF